MDSNLYILRRNILSLRICLQVDTLYVCRTRTHKAKTMIDILIIILPTFWISFAAYLAWYVTSAKRNVSITFDDAKALWQIHKKTAQCSSRKWNPISRKGGKISGFHCECGYKYTQRRPLLSSKPRVKQSNQDHRSQTGFPVVSY